MVASVPRMRVHGGLAGAAVATAPDRGHNRRISPVSSQAMIHTPSVGRTDGHPELLANGRCRGNPAVSQRPTKTRANRESNRGGLTKARHPSPAPTGQRSSPRLHVWPPGWRSARRGRGVFELIAINPLPRVGHPSWTPDTPRTALSGRAETWRGDRGGRAVVGPVQRQGVAGAAGGARPGSHGALRGIGMSRSGVAVRVVGDRSSRGGTGRPAAARGDRAGTAPKATGWHRNPGKRRPRQARPGRRQQGKT